MPHDTIEFRPLLEQIDQLPPKRNLRCVAPEFRNNTLQGIPPSENIIEPPFKLLRAQHSGEYDAVDLLLIASDHDHARAFGDAIILFESAQTPTEIPQAVQADRRRRIGGEIIHRRFEMAAKERLQ